jgi:WD40 repeat protein
MSMTHDEPMSERSGLGLDHLDLDLARCLEAVCRRFEADWRGGGRPRVEDYLAEIPAEARPALRAELIALERELRQSATAPELPMTPPGTVAEAPTLAPGIAPTSLPPGAVSAPIHEEATLPPRDEATVDQNPAESTPPEAAAPARVRYFGDYEILRELARGGMGVVFLARQISLNRSVALKMILAGQLAHDTDVKRFYTEAEAAANLDHPGIVPIYEVGQHESQHYFSMGFVEGQSLAQRLAGGPLPPREAAAVVAKVAEAIDYAHQHGVIHRDLKPGNILLDPQGNPRVTDFGLAKKLEGDSGLTGSGQIMGTPSYMPPEQAGGTRGEVGPPADIYALGATLYALVTGRPPFQAATAMDTVLMLVSEEPVPPRRLNATIPRDLETICLKCLEKQPARRYASAAAFGEDLRRFLAGEPILARPVGSVERARKWARRRPAAAALVGVSSLTFIALTLGGFGYSAQLRDFNTRLQAALGDAKKERDEADVQRRRALDQERLALRQEAATRRSLYSAHMNLAQRSWEMNNVVRVLDLLNQHRPEPGREDLRSFEWYHLWHLCHGARWNVNDHQGEVTSVAFAPNGRLLATASADRTVKLRDPATGNVLAAWERLAEPVGDVEFSPDSKLLVLVAGGTVKLWDVASRQERAALPKQPAPVSCLAFAGDGVTLAAGGGGPGVVLWNTANGRITSLNGPGGEVAALAFSPDGRTLAVGGSFEGAAQLFLWDLASGQKRALKRKPARDPSVPRVPEDARKRFFLVGMGTIVSVAFSPDSKVLASGFGMSGDSGDGETVTLLWDAATGEERAILSGHRDTVATGAFAPDGRTLATGSRDNTLRLWDPDSGREKAVFRGHTSGILSVAFAPDGKTLATGSLDRSVRLWDVVPEPERNTLRGDQLGVNCLAISPDDRTLATGGWDGRTRLWSLATGRPLGTLEGTMQAAVRTVAFAPDGKTLVTGCNDRVVRLWDPQTQRVRQSLAGHTQEVRCAAFAPDGRTLATGSEDKTVILWNLTTGQSRAVLRDHPNDISTLAFSPDGKTLAVGSGEPIYQFNKTKEVRLWDLATGRVEWVLPEPPAAVTSVAFSPDGKLLAVAHADAQNLMYPGVAMLWDLATRQAVATLRGHKSMIWCLAFSPDGKTLATASHDELVKLWDPITGQERATLEGHTGPVSSLAFSRDNTLLASAGGAPVELTTRAGEVILWRAAGREEVAGRGEEK